MGFLVFFFCCCTYQCCGSGMFIPDPGSDFFPSRIRTVSIPDPGSSSKNLSILTPKKPKNWFLSSKNYDPGCSSRIRMLTFYPSRIPGSKRHSIPDPQHWYIFNLRFLDLSPGLGLPPFYLVSFSSMNRNRNTDH